MCVSFEYVKYELNLSAGDRVTLLLWYKEDNVGMNLGRGKGSPIYRIDARTNKDLVIGSHKSSRAQILDWVNEKVRTLNIPFL